MSDISLTPNDNGGGELPSGYDLVTFTMSDGNWVGEIILPQQPSHNNQVNIVSHAQLGAKLKTKKEPLPMDGFSIGNGTNYLFTYDANNGQWTVTGTGVSELSPNQVGAVIPQNPAAITNYTLSDGNWVGEIVFPTQAANNDTIYVKSNATWESTVSEESLLYSSTIRIQTGDLYAFKFVAAFGKWVLWGSPTRDFGLLLLSILQMPAPTAPRTLVTFYDGNWIPEIRLPQTAGDRDRVIIRSTAVWEAGISALNVNNPAAMRLNSGDEYEFLYLAEKGGWELVRYPETVYQANDLTNGNLPALTRPRTVIQVANGNWHQTMTLPSSQPAGSRVVVKSTAEWTTNIAADGNSYPVAFGEIVAFRVNGTGAWEKETITIDLLLLFSDKAANALGEAVVRQRLSEAFNLTNEALENSGVNFRFRARDVRMIEAKPHWTTLLDPLQELRDDPITQGWRDELAADGIYYEGTEEGCGLAWGGESDYNMVATGSIGCGTTVMRHELGHNMGLAHGGESSSYNQGYTLIGTIMAGNGIPYYSTPHRYTADCGIPMGIENQIDAVRAMNEVSAIKAAFR